MSSYHNDTDSEICRINLTTTLQRPAFIVNIIEFVCSRVSDLCRLKRVSKDWFDTIHNYSPMLWKRIITWSDMYPAVCRNDMYVLRIGLQMSPKMNILEQLLDESIMRRYDDTATLLLQHISPNPQLFELAIKLSSIKMLELWIEYGAICDTTSLLVACESRDVHVVKLLMSNGAQPDRHTNGGSRAYDAARTNEIRSYLREQGFGPTSTIFTTNEITKVDMDGSLTSGSIRLIISYLWVISLYAWYTRTYLLWFVVFIISLVLIGSYILLMTCITRNLTIAVIHTLFCLLSIIVASLTTGYYIYDSQRKSNCSCTGMLDWIYKPDEA